MLFIAICAFVCGADKWTEVVEFGLAKEKWFKQLLLTTQRYFLTRYIWTGVFCYVPQNFKRVFWRG
ncbi:MAG: transposase family protein [Thiotrichaceae bacterium]|nr:transposase family protein [Thiotrichaceae bacterium]PCI12953.1 MAG: hypothetical protein COB71_07545 [Thiotrichales bacterium]